MALQLSHIVSITGRSNRLPGGTVGLITSGRGHVTAAGGSKPGSTTAPKGGTTASGAADHGAARPEDARPRPTRCGS